MKAHDQPGRRDFLKISAVAGLAAANAAPMWHTVAAAADSQTKQLKKAVKYGMIQAGNSVKEKFQLLKELGFDGVEMDSPSKLDSNEVLRARDEVGLPIHGVVDSVHWRDTLSDPDPTVRARGLEGLKIALHDAKQYGGTTVLLVPAVVNKEVSYADAYTRSQVEIRKAIPLANELGIKIALENVWNNFLLSPLEEARYIDEFDSPLVGAYFDVGNVLRYGWPEHWITTLGPRIMKLDIKEFSRKKQNEEGLGKGFDVELLQGDCDWPAVMAALRTIKYSGWATAEIPGGGHDRLQTIAANMDRIFAS
ncbi:MAG TPA: sugar phosphate isomerase/epimerase family protein [Pirellulales bacterium]|jgi:hexulose-6-phosphate isomerase